MPNVVENMTFGFYIRISASECQCCFPLSPNEGSVNVFRENVLKFCDL